MPMTAGAKSALSSTIRSLRARLLDDLHNAVESDYRLSARAQDAGLDEATRARRGRFEAWIEEQVRAQDATKTSSRLRRSSADFRYEAEKQAAYTLMNRLVMLRLMEAPGPSGQPVRAPAVLTGGWESRGYQDFRQLAPALVRGDATEGYAFLLRLTFEDLATELPGLYGRAGVADLVPVPAATLRHLVDALNAEALESCWTDDMTLGWVYQYWNDPEREALDDKLNAGGKVERHEIASKTQMFTERYMVDWLLQNSLGPMWLAICEKHGWTPEVQTAGTLSRLEERRADWRAKRVSGEAALTELMPLHTDAERHWAYYVPQPIPSDAVAQAPDTVRDLKILDPAVGSGHFLVVVLDLLVALYREEARHRGEVGGEGWSDRAIVERVLSHNLHGIDLDPRAVQIAAAALWLKARQVAPDARPERLNLVAANLRLGGLAEDDPALVELRREVERETGIPDSLTDRLIQALKGAEHLGSLLKVDTAVDEALARHEVELSREIVEQGDLFNGFTRPRIPIGRDEAKATLLDRLEGFLAKHTSGDDLGLRLRGEQLATGVRFVRLVREGTYDLVVANPPYQGTSKMTDARYVEHKYPPAKADLYAAFLLRGLDLVRDGGFAAQVSMNGWMFLKQYAELRRRVLSEHSVRSVADLLWGAFEEMRDNTVAMYCLMRGPAEGANSVGLVPTPREEKRDRSASALHRKRAALLCHDGRRTFEQASLKVVPEWPITYWWTPEFVQRYKQAPKLGSAMESRVGVRTSNNSRFIRRPWEVPLSSITLQSIDSPRPLASQMNFVPHVMGAAGRAWLEDVGHVINWSFNGLEVCVTLDHAYGAYPQATDYYFHPLVALPKIGSNFRARTTRYRSIFDCASPSVFPTQVGRTVTLLNRTSTARFIQDINPTVNVQPGDIDRIALFAVPGADSIWEQVVEAFALRERGRELSVEFKQPAPSPWRHAQDWAQAAVDRPEGTPLPEYIAQFDPEPPTDHLSFALGAALGRFAPAGSDAEGALDLSTADLSHTLPDGILFLDTTLGTEDHRDGLGHPAATPLHLAWAQNRPVIDTRRDLRDWLAVEFFKDVHKSMYENRPIYWPLSSSGRTFVAWVNIHRMNEQTLYVLLADHLVPTLTRLDGELSDLRSARDGGDKQAARDAERRYDRVLKSRDELQAFIDAVEQCADRGAPPTDGKCPARERDARYSPNLNDGVMINSAGLWPLLEPQWKDPKKWWKELATAQGRKDYDWSDLATRYWPSRVDQKCQQDPSLGVAHGCFWRYHPKRAWSWELRLQDEIGPSFTIEEAPYRPGGRDLGDLGDVPHRDAFLRDNPTAAIAAIAKEATRRMGRGRSRKPVPEMRILDRGLWTGHTAEMWELELDLAEKQGGEIRILAPDEPAARAAFEAGNPDKVRDRKSFLASLVPPAGFFDEGGNASDSAESEEEVT